jgi:hypothetical protein
MDGNEGKENGNVRKVGSENMIASFGSYVVVLW